MLFLGYHDDREEARELSRRLRKVGVEVWCSADDEVRRTGPGWPEEAVQAIHDADRFLALLGRSGIGGGLRDEVSHALARRSREGAFPVIPIALPSAPRDDAGRIEVPRLLCIFDVVELPSDWRTRDDEYFRQLAVRRLGHDTPEGSGVLEPGRGRSERAPQPPRIASPSVHDHHGLHADSIRLARHLCEMSGHAQVGGELFHLEQIRTALGMSQDALDMAVNELQEHAILRNREGGAGRGTVMAEVALFLRFDPEVKGWHAEEDALVIARTLADRGSSKTADIAQILGWPTRRMNPACEVLVAEGLVDARKYYGPSPFTYGVLTPNTKTKRLARDGA